VVEEQGRPLVLACNQRPVLAFVPHRVGIGRPEIVEYRKHLREQAAYLHCVSEWGYDSDYDSALRPE